MDHDLDQRFQRLDDEIRIAHSMIEELNREWARYSREEDSDTETVVEEWVDPYRTPPDGYSPVPDNLSDMED